MSETPIYPFSYILAANKSLSYKARCKSTALSLYRFLKNNGLSKRDLLTPLDEAREWCDIWAKDLTDEGAEFMSYYKYQWLKRTDKAGKESDVSYLERELKKWREERS